MEGRIVSINISKNKDKKKKPVLEEHEVIRNLGLKDDGHALKDSLRQVSLLSLESIKKMEKMGLNVGPGDFAENITTSQIDLLSLKPGEQIKIGEDVLLEITQIGKVCNDRCAIYYQVGDCIMPKEGIFAKVINGGKIKKGDKIEKVV